MPTYPLPHQMISKYKSLTFEVNLQMTSETPKLTAASEVATKAEKVLTKLKYFVCYFIDKRHYRSSSSL